MGLVGHSGMLIRSAIRAATLQTLATKTAVHLLGSKSPLQERRLKPDAAVEFRCCTINTGFLPLTGPAQAPGDITTAFFKVQGSRGPWTFLSPLFWSQEMKQWSRLPLHPISCFSFFAALIIVMPTLPCLGYN